VHAQSDKAGVIRVILADELRRSPSCANCRRHTDRSHSSILSTRCSRNGAPSPGVTRRSRDDNRCAARDSRRLFRQAKQRRAAEQVNDHIRRRLETALSRGRADYGTGTSLTAAFTGRTQCMRSGRKAERRCLSIGELMNCFILTTPTSPKSRKWWRFQDKKRRRRISHQELSRRLVLVARASGACRRHARAGRHLVGIAVDISSRKRSPSRPRPRM